MNLYCVVILVLFYEVSSTPLTSSNSHVTDVKSKSSLFGGDSDLQKFNTLNGNHYFQALHQVFNIYNVPQPPKEQDPKEPPKEEEVTEEPPKEEDPKEPPSEEKPKFPEDYEYVRGYSGAFKLHSELKSWNDARNACIQEKAHLAVTGAYSDMIYIQQTNKKNNIVGAWIGLHSQFQKDNWVTIFDVPLNNTNYLYWAPGQPEPDNRENGGRYCVSYYFDIGIVNSECKLLLPFYCKIDV